MGNSGGFLNGNPLVQYDGSWRHKLCVESGLKIIKEFMKNDFDLVGVKVEGWIFKKETTIVVKPVLLPKFTHHGTIPASDWLREITKRLEPEIPFCNEKLDIMSSECIRSRHTIPRSLTKEVLRNYISEKTGLSNKKILLNVKNNNIENFLEFEKIIEEKSRLRQMEWEKKWDEEQERKWEKERQKEEKLDNYLENIDRVRELKRSNPILKRELNFESGLEAIIEINFKDEQKIKSRYFLSKKNKDIITSRDFFETTDTNFFHLLIEVSRKGENTTWNKKGEKEVGDNFESGYTLVITLKFDDRFLRYVLIENLKEFGFGALPSAKTIHCHKDSSSPTTIDAKNLLREIVEKLSLDETYIPSGTCKCGHEKSEHNSLITDSKFDEIAKEWISFDKIACTKCHCKTYDYDFETTKHN